MKVPFKYLGLTIRTNPTKKSF